MKSAYERAMERFGGDQPEVSLTDKQREDLAAVEEKYRAKIAEKEIFLGGLIEGSNDPVDIRQIEEQRRREISRLEKERESEKDRIRQGEAD